MKTTEDIVSAYKERKKNRSSVLATARLVSLAYNNEMPIPLPELDKNELPIVPNLLQQGIDQTAMRIASTLPDVRYLPVREDIKLHEDRARLRREANLGWWTSNNMGLKLRRRARWLIGYASAPVLLRPDRRRQMPVWRNRSPLHTFAAPTGDPDDMEPPDCIFSFQRSYSWLRQNYPEAAARLNLPTNRQGDIRGDEQVEMVEYVDDEHFVLIAVGVEPSDTDPPDIQARTAQEELERIDNRAEVCTAIVPGRIALDSPVGQFDGTLGMYQHAAKLMALHSHAVQKGIHPEMWAVARSGETPRIIETADSRTGEIGIIEGGDLKEISPDPGFMTPNTIDRVMEAFRQTGGMPAEFSGQAATNVRTGKRAEQLLSAVVDFPVQEAQEILERSLEAENQRAAAIDKGWWGNKTKSFYMSWRKSSKRGDYTPNETFDDDINIVEFPLSGTDANGFTIRGGQKIGLGVLARQTFMERDPEIDDAEKEDDRIVFERLREGVLTEFEQPGSLPLDKKVRAAHSILRNKKEFLEAMVDVQKELQEEQAEQAGGEPEAQPGLAEGGPQPPPQAPGLADLVGQLQL